MLIHAAAGESDRWLCNSPRFAAREVIGTASSSEHLSRSATGCDQAIDYKATRFEDRVHDADSVLDPVGNGAAAIVRRAQARRNPRVVDRRPSEELAARAVRQ